MNPYAVFDFHLHTWWSYDACTPPEYYFRRAEELKLQAFAVTDHHNNDALPEIREIAKRHPEAGFVSGAELTASTPFGEMDLVCLGLPFEPTPEFAALKEEYHVYQRKMGDAISRRVELLGHAYTREDRKKLLLRYRPEFTLDLQGVTHVRNEIQADYLVSRGVAGNIQEWYGCLWGKNRVPGLLPVTPEADRVARIVHQAGGLVFIAHPYEYFNRADEKRMDALREFIQLDGIECAHPMIPAEYTPVYRKYCLKHHLLSSAGTDVHCDPPHADLHLSDGSDMACHLGKVSWLEEILERVPLYHG